MKNVTVNLGARKYEIRIGRGLLSMADEIVPWIGGRQVCLVSDEVVAPLYLARLRNALPGKQVVSVILPTGESAKSLDGAARIFDALLRAPCDREVTVLALGGGVVGDLAGFAAACYQRGVPFIQAPTTLLAQVDSSVGGKTGVNHALGKNMIGAFHQPRRVLADTATLDTLDRRQFAAGMAEVIKYGVICDRDFFVWLEENIDAIMARDADATAQMIERSCVNKAKIVEQDELESGARALLNLGHTFGHAIETGSGYGVWLHGEAVATGIAMAAYMACEMARISTADCARIIDLLSAAGLPVGPFTGVPAERMLALMTVDKKVRDGKLRLVLPKGIGNAEIVSEYPMEILTETVTRFTSSKVRRQNQQTEQVVEKAVTFDGNDDHYQKWLASNSHGFVINTSRLRDRQSNYMVLHRATCATVSTYTEVGRPAGGFTERSYIKICAPTVKALRVWAKNHGRNDGSFTKECGNCKPV